MDGGAYVVGTCKVRKVHADHLIAHQFVNPGVGIQQHVSAGREEAADQLAEFRRLQLFTQPGGTPHVGKEQRQLDFRTAKVIRRHHLALLAEFLS